MQSRQHWENIYAGKTPQEVSWYQKTPEISLQLIHDTGAGTDAAIIDVGGGASKLVDHLVGRGYTSLAVLDISGRALDYARQRLDDKAGNIEWIETDITDFHPDKRYDIWHDRAVFHFLTAAADRRKYVEAMQQALKPEAHVIIATFAIGGPTRCSGLEIVQYDADKLTAELGSAFRLVAQQSETHTTPAGDSQAFMHYRFAYTMP